MSIIISSQRYLNEQIVWEKMEQMEGLECITLPVTTGVIDGVVYSVLRDGHHRLEAAKRLGICVEFEEDCSNETPKVIFDFEKFLLDECWVDSDFYDIFTGAVIWQ